jgi:hypothetical protein
MVITGPAAPIVMPRPTVAGLFMRIDPRSQALTLEDLRQDPTIESTRDRIPEQTTSRSFEFLDLTSTASIWVLDNW